MTFRRAITFGGAFALMASAAIAQTCPSNGIDARTSIASGDDFASGLTIGLTAGGDIDLGECADLPGIGAVIEAPDFSLSYGGGTGGDVTLETDAECDTILLVNDATGEWHFDDDAGGSSNAKLTLQDAEAGRIDVWVGTFGEDLCQSDLKINSGTDLLPTCPNYGLSGDEHTFSGDDLYGGQSLDVYAGGDIDLGACNDLPGTGNVIEAPDFTITYEETQDYDLRFRTEAESDCDTVLLVNDSTGEWYFDDDSGEGSNAELTLESAAGGLIDVWVGTYDNDYCSANLLIDTLDR
ncbi:MAG: hypothetical protein AAF583_10370 [Pseudomonadota bacterium]